ncbi:MAG: ABC transporter ATP-binding protein/permease [Clostridia bacterium]|nr:ABC transporter ATP-binding protein/permease [Clostridia bacterium]
MREPRMNLSDRRDLPVEQKKANRRHTLRTLLRYLRPHMGVVVTVLIGEILSIVLSLMGPYLCGIAVEDITNGDFSRIWQICAVLIIIYAVSEIINYLSSLGMAYVSKKVTYRMRQELFSRIVHLPVSYFDSRPAGDIISVLSYDVDTVGVSLCDDVMLVLKSVIQMVGSLVMLIIVCPALCLIFVVTVPIALFATRYIARRVQPLYRNRSRKLGELNGYVEEILTGQKTTKAYGREAETIAEFEKRNVEAVDAYTKSEYYGTITGPTVGFVNNLSLTLISVFGALMFIFGTGMWSITISQISSFILYSRKFTGPINEMANVIGDMQSAIAAAERVFRTLDEKEEAPDAEDAKELADVKGEVELKDVSFGYLPDTPILRGFSMTAKSGKVIAIVGHTGAGKTTVINLLMRFYDAGGGSICVDGNDIYGVTRQSLRGSYTMVLQDAWLFAGTVYENIAYGKEGATMEEVVEVCKKAKIHSFISKLPQGYDTVLSDNATNISKGQKQLLTIARAMLMDSKMLILDEATSNVDTRTEQIIQAAMQDLMKGRTCFVIAHRLSTIKNADHILVMDGGDVVEQGTHEELIAAGGAYAKLYEAQFLSSV